MSGSTVYDVAIVGYGPAGVVAAGLLGQKGLKVYVCERLLDVYQIPRAAALDHEIMRVFQQLGVVDAVAPFTEPFTNSEFFGVDGQLIRRMTMVAPPYPQGYTPSLVFTQPQVERILRERVARLPNVDVELGVEMTRVTPDAGGVTLDIVHPQRGAGQVRAKYVIACDGGSSTVRTQLGMQLEDLDFDEPWLVVDVLVNERGLAKLPKVSVQYCEPERPCTLVICPKNHRRFEISLKEGEDPKQVATPEATWKLLSRWLTPEDGELWRQASYRFHALVASDWRQGRVFLAGDAAHMQPPFLGQGMCQGIRDVTNLAWKLAAVLRGEVTGAAAQALLDSYGAERKAHVRELTRSGQGARARREVAGRLRRRRQGHAAPGHPAAAGDRPALRRSERRARQSVPAAVAAARRHAAAHGRRRRPRLAAGAGARHRRSGRDLAGAARAATRRTAGGSRRRGRSVVAPARMRRRAGASGPLRVWRGVHARRDAFPHR
ncbi:MAG: bifunctional 3-(3-hydroxy-phenyl)propionate/3-hydroxycinnamic acid hydroxylase [Ramlibacter sp.]|nr:bifunctional 3-(3-hydroxy-phenyl)propionate/3-hydroxycinnamic acid hydroxylase [Ramlibacter sp.]